MIIFMGLAGSGKSTQGQLLAANLHCPWISTGNLLRQKMDPQIQAEMLQGHIIDDQRTLDILEEEFQRIHADGHDFILDGSPRTMRQAEWLVDKFKNGGLTISGVIHLIVPKKVAKQRLLARMRPDDHDKAITERFHEYEESVAPIVNYLKEQGVKVFDIDGSRSPEDVDHEILKVLGKTAK